MILKMRRAKIDIKDLFINTSKLTFLIGAGCSIDAPSCLLARNSMMERIIRLNSEDNERYPC